MGATDHYGGLANPRYAVPQNLTVAQKANNRIDEINQEIARLALERVRWRRIAQEYAGSEETWEEKKLPAESVAT